MPALRNAAEVRTVLVFGAKTILSLIYWANSVHVVVKAG